MTKPTDKETLGRFYQTVKPGGPGWAPISKELELDDEKAWDVPRGIVCAVVGCFTVYGCIFATGSLIYGKASQGLLVGIPTLVLGALLIKTWNSIQTDVD